MKLWHTVLIVVLVFACIYAANTFQPLKSITNG
jgi:hypothetical protein